MTSLPPFPSAATALLLLAGPLLGQLDLPSRVPPRGAPEEPSGGPAAEVEATGPAALFEALGPRLRCADPRVEQAIEALVSQGEPALLEARRRLTSAVPARLAVALGLLARHGTPADRTALQARLTERLPGRGQDAAWYLAELLRGAPELAAGTTLIPWLDHPDGSMRGAVREWWNGRVSADHVPALRALLASDRSSTREAVLELLGTLEGPPGIESHLVHLGDLAAGVASAAVEHLALRTDAGLGERLLGIAFEARLFDRRECFALLALLEREERLGERWLVAEHVPRLRQGLADPRPLVSGTCAAALGSLGYRSEEPGALPWLDREVPHALVKELGGENFHRDFRALRRPAARVLERLTGERFGTDGAAWIEWWSAAIEGFRARRAVLPGGPEDAPGMIVELEAAALGGALRLLGPAHAEAWTGERDGVLLDPDQGQRLWARLEALAVRTAQRAPGRRGEVGPWRHLRVALPHGEKAFALGAEVTAPWLDALVEEARALRDANAWQRWLGDHGPAAGPEAWNAERASWSALTDPVARDRRTTERVLEHLARWTPQATGRDDRLAQARAELERLLARPDVARAADVDALLALLARFDPQAQGDALVPWLALLQRVAAATGLETTQRQRLLDLLADRFPERAAGELERLLDPEWPELVLRAAQDPRGALRRAAARPLARLAQGATVPTAARQRLEALITDSEPAVVARAVECAGGQGLAGLRAAIVAASRSAHAPVRAAALRALAALGDPETAASCRRALDDADPGVQLAAVEAMAELGDPGNAAWLAERLAEGDRSPFFAAARRGLERLGPAAHGVLLERVASPRRATRRAAALILARGGDARVVVDLLTLLTEDPADTEVARELAIATAFDARSVADPVAAWWSWWDASGSGSPARWLREGLEREGWSGPPEGALEGPGRRDGAEFLLELCLAPREHLAERARRELARRLERAVDPVPEGADARRLWYGELRGAIEERLPE